MIKTSTSEWLKLIEEIKNCRKCSLYKYRRNPVPGEGPLNAKLMFIGEAPGGQEDAVGRPFVGTAGKFLTELLNSNGISRGEVFIGNLLKCRPPNNRDPLPEEIEKCSPYLLRQIEIIRPKMIVCLGRFSSKFILERMGYRFSSISRVRGRTFTGTICNLKVIVFTTYHPAVALYRPQYRKILEEDFREIARVYREIIRGEPRDRKKVTLEDFIDFKV